MKTSFFELSNNKPKFVFYDFDSEEMVFLNQYYGILDRRGQLRAIPKDATSLRIHIGIDFNFLKIVGVGNYIVG